MISYSLYMWHIPFLLVFIKWGQLLLKGWSPEQAYSVYRVLVMIIPFCFLFYIWVEKPWTKLGERFTRQKARSTHELRNEVQSNQAEKEKRN